MLCVFIGIELKRPIKDRHKITSYRKVFNIVEDDTNPSESNLSKKNKES